MGIPLIFRHGAAETAFMAALVAWLVYWIKVQPGHRVVTGGPYRYVRHPSCTGLALVLAGIALASDDVGSLVAVAVLGGW